MAPTVAGKTALQWVKEQGHAECVRAFEEHAEADGAAAVRHVSGSSPSQKVDPELVAAQWLARKSA